jgi:hypothetical protein
LEVPLAGVKLIDGMWVYNIKVDGNGNFVKTKACWVCQGDCMVAGVDYSDTWAMVAQLESVQMVMAICAVKGLATRQWDFSGAYLNGMQVHPVWMKQPLGFVKPGEEHLACQLQRALYGLPDAGHIWYKALRNGYQKLGFYKPKADPCIQTCTKPEYTITTTHTDNVFAGSGSDDKIDQTCGKFHKLWDLESVDNRRLLLGITVEKQANSDIWITQGPYFERVL